jgi:hypothetical protein
MSTTPDSSSPEDEPAIIKRDFRPSSTSKNRQPINFIRASNTERITSINPSTPQGLGDSYLAVVLGPSHSDTSATTSSSPTSRNLDAPKLCEVCNLPLPDLSSDDAPHATSIAHQVCLAHTHVPSALDRRRKGLAYLEEYGWDPDARKGLGKDGEGILFPLQPKERSDRAGIAEREDNEKEKRRKAVKIEKEKKLSAGQVKKAAVEEKKKAEKLRKLFYMDDEVLKHLGEHG